MKKAIMMDAKDNVANAISAITAGEEVEILSTKQEVVQRVRARESLPLGHKIALTDINAGGNQEIRGCYWQSFKAHHGR